MTGVGAIRILLVEDEMLIRELAVEDLTEARFDVVACGTGDEALAVLERDRNFQLLFTDIHMPGAVDGRMLAVRARAAMPGLPVIYATGADDPMSDLSDAERCVRKPYVFGEVLKAMTELGIIG